MAGAAFGLLGILLHLNHVVREILHGHHQVLKHGFDFFPLAGHRRGAR